MMSRRDDLQRYPRSLIGLCSFVLFAAVACAAEPATSTASNSVCPADALNVSRTIEVAPGDGAISAKLSEGEVVLTFDDGPHRRRTRRVLDVLDRECVRAAFFLRGDEARRNRKISREIVARGHALGGHGWAHRDLTKLSPSDARADITRGLRGIERAFRRSAQPPTIGFFRFPFVARTDALSAQLVDMGLAEIGVDVDGKDWTGNSAVEIVDLVMTGLEARSRRGVVLLHDPFGNSVEATELLLARLKAENYAIVEIVPAGTR